MKAHKTQLTLSDFCRIFDYGNGNSGELMYKRFTEQFNSNVELFKAHLCTIDQWKWDRYFSKKRYNA